MYWGGEGETTRWDDVGPPRGKQLAGGTLVQPGENYSLGGLWVSRGKTTAYGLSCIFLEVGLYMSKGRGGNGIILYIFGGYPVYFYRGEGYPVYFCGRPAYTAYSGF